ncbi:hypothetical protein AGMMS49992_18060 [Clostridia bacterium]|nr:hypothetical protein AGMMS49992_18060 [Clostridia bacterium]
MPLGTTSGQTTIRDDCRANTFVHTTSIRGGFEPPPPAKPRFSWGIKRNASAAKPKAAKRHVQVPSDEPTANARTAVTFQVKVMDEPAPPRDSMTRLTARVTANTKPMYSANDYPTNYAEEKVNSKVEREATANFKPLHFGERMLRNTAVCVAILLCALAIRTVDAPIARTVSSELHDWVTMDLDESLGSLKFVQNLLPDAALVFWHIGSQQIFEPPSNAVLSHSWNENEPYLTYISSQQNPIYSAASGEVADITYLENGTATLRLRHDGGMETVYGNLASTTVREGDIVSVSQIIGASDTLYFEIRGEGRSMNPAPLMAAKNP